MSITFLFDIFNFIHWFLLLFFITGFYYLISDTNLTYILNVTTRIHKKISNGSEGVVSVNTQTIIADQ